MSHFFVGLGRVPFLAVIPSQGNTLPQSKIANVCLSCYEYVWVFAVFSLYSLGILSVFSLYSLCILSVFPLYSLCILSVFSLYSLGMLLVFSLYSLCSLSVPGFFWFGFFY